MHIMTTLIATCFLTFYCDPYFLFKFKIIAYVYFLYNTIPSSYNPIKCVYGLWWSHMARPASVEGVIASNIPCKEEVVATQMWNYVYVVASVNI